MWTPLAHAQVVGMQDLFTYNTGTSTINGHAPTTGTSTWSLWNSGTGCGISTNGTCALINAQPVGTGQTIADYRFILQPSTLYTLNVTVYFTGPTNTTAGFFGMGFANKCSSGGGSSDPSPFVYMWQQAHSTDTPRIAALWGQANPWNGTVPAAYFSAPIQLTVTWNTSTSQAQYYLNGVLQTTCTTGAAVTGTTSYVYLQGFGTGNFATVRNITLTAQTLQIAKMQDNFNYTSSNINGHAPRVTSGAWGVWATNNSSNSSVAATGTQANLICNSGTLGAGQALASYAFLPNTNTFYTLRITFLFNSVVGSITNLWAGFGFSNSTGGGLSGSNTAPNMYIQPQATGTSNQYASCNIGPNPIVWTTVAAAAYQAPITATVTWNTSTGEAKYYINGLYQCTGTTTVPSGPYYAFLAGLGTGSAVSVLNITLTSQSLPLPVVSLDPPWYQNGVVVPDIPALFDSGTGSAAWASARSHVTYMNPPCEFFGAGLNPTDGPLITMLNYLRTNNLKLMVAFNAIVDNGSHYPGSSLLSTATYTAERVYRLSGSNNSAIDTLDMDDPLYWGHVYTSGAMLSISDLCSNAHQFIQGYQSYFPNVKVRDVDPTANIPAADILTWITDFPLAGSPALGSITNDICYTGNSAQYDDQETKVIETTQAGTGYGMCLDGVGVVNTSNEQWILSALEGVQIFHANAQLSSLTSVISFEDWDPYTTKIIPETSPGSFMYMVNYFFTSPQAHEPPPVRLYRLYYGGYDYYTSDPNERASLLVAGWNDFGTIGGIEPFRSCAIGLVPMYRYHKGSGMTILHSYAVTAAEQTALIGAGFTFDKIEGYVFPSTASSSGGVPLYCAYNPNTGDYWYNESYSVYQSQITAGWTGKGIECYLMPRWQF